ncbi:MAG: Fe2+/Zn2+ uptake regulation protein [Thermoleophilia bacterium]|jgi:Fur family ferric uptake transcriptional regulator|nr:Fe2+/Zn2+ uptake regulation protein [Thermoleophilia bacterium]
MSDALQDAATLLRDHGLRVTDQRVEVLDALAGAAGDATAQSLHEVLQSTGSKVGVATVYRTLAALAESGVIDALQHGASTCYRLCAPGHHHHLTCERCHAVEELHDCDLDDWTRRVARRHGYVGVSHTVELRGTCRTCRTAG